MVSLHIDFKFLSGSHIGQTLTLVPGVYSMGSDDSCDIILNDATTEPICAELYIDDDLVVKVKAKYGNVIFKGESLKDREMVFNAGDVLALNMCSLTYLKGDMSIADISLKDFGFKKADDKKDVNDATDKNTVDSATESKVANKSDTTKALDKGAGLNLKSHGKVTDSIVLLKPKKTSKCRSFSFLLVGLIILILLLLSLISGSFFFGHGASQRRAMQEINAYIEVGKYDQIKAYMQNDIIYIEGSVNTDKEYLSFTDNIPKSQFLYAINIDVNDAYLKALEKSFWQYGYLVKASYIKYPHEILLKGYVDNRYTEWQIINEIASEYSNLELKSGFIYKDDLKEIVDKVNASLNTKVNFVYDKNKVTYSGKLTLAKDKALKELFTKVQETSGCPVLFVDSDLMENDASIKSLSATTSTKDEATKADDDSAKDNESLSSDAIVSITMEPMRFITLKNGTKYFEGSVLPSGDTLLHISLDKVTLERAGVKRDLMLR